MPAIFPWEEDNPWLRMGEDDPMALAQQGRTPPFLPSHQAGRSLPGPSPVTPDVPINSPLPPIPPIGPAGPPTGKVSALEQLGQLQSQRPQQSDPQFQPGKARKILGAIAGIGAGAAAGYLNTAGKGFRVDPSTGARLGSAITNSKYNKAMRDYTEQEQGLERQAQIEGAQEERSRKEAESQARIRSEGAQEAAANAAQARALRPEPPKYQEVQGGLYNVTENKWVIEPPPAKEQAGPATVEAVAAKDIAARINAINADPMITPEVKADQVDKVLSHYNAQKKPEKPTLIRNVDPNGNVTVTAVKASDVANAGGTKTIGKTRLPAVPGTDNEDKRLTPNEAKMLGVPYGTTRKEAYGTKATGNLSSAQQASLAGMDTTEELIDEVLGYIKDGELPGVGRIAGPLGAAATATFGMGSEGAKNVRQLIGNLRSAIVTLRAGKALTATEKKLLDTFVPDYNAHSADVIAKLNGLKNYITTWRNKTLQYAGRGTSEPQEGGPAGRPTAPKVPAGAAKLKVGDIKMIRGVKHRIKQVFPDGSFDADPVKE